MKFAFRKKSSIFTVTRTAYLLQLFTFNYSDARISFSIYGYVNRMGIGKYLLPLTDALTGKKIQYSTLVPTPTCADIGHFTCQLTMTLELFALLLDFISVFCDSPLDVLESNQHMHMHMWSTLYEYAQFEGLVPPLLSKMQMQIQNEMIANRKIEFKMHSTTISWQNRLKRKEKKIESEGQPRTKQPEA